MNTVYDRAEVLCAILVLGGLSTVPDRNGILDASLEAVADHLPEPLRSGLYFSLTSVGRRAHGLADIISAAMETGLTEWNGGRMDDLRLKLSFDGARTEAVAHGSTTKGFIEIGRNLALEIGQRVTAVNRGSPTNP